MPAVSVAGAAINLSVDAVQYESQITTGTITTTPTIVRTKTLDSVAFDQTDLNSTMSVDFLYDEAAGLPDEGIAPGTRWDDVPMNWTCPECGARKDDFEMVQL